MDYKETPQNSLEVSKGAYLNRLPEKEREEVNNLIASFTDTMHGEKRKGALIAVGGVAKNKPWPRKDIDIVMIYIPEADDPKEEGFNSNIQYAKADYEIYRKLIESMVNENALQITDMIYPTIDPEFNIDSLVSTEGAFRLEDVKNNCVPIEILRSRQKGRAKDIVRSFSEPYTVLVEII